MDIKENKNKRWIWKYLLAYALFVVILILAAFLLFRIRMNIVQISFLLGYNQVEVKGISNLGVLISGVALLAGIIFSEDYLRNGVQDGSLFRRARRIFSGVLAIILISFLLYYGLMLIAV